MKFTTQQLYNNFGIYNIELNMGFKNLTEIFYNILSILNK